MNNLLKKITSLNFFAGILSCLFIGNSFQTDLQSQLLASWAILAFGFYSLLRIKDFRIEKIDFIAILFLLFFNFSFIFSQTPFGFKEFNTFNFGFLLYFTLKNWNPTEDSSLFKKLCPPILSGLFSVSIFIFLLEFINSPNDRFAGFFLGDQIYSIYPNVFATFLLFIIPIIFYFYFKSDFQKNRTTKLLHLIALLLGVTSLWLTSSRGVLISFSALLGITTAYLLIKYRTIKGLFLSVVFVFIVLISTFVFSETINKSKIYNLNFQDRVTVNQDISAQKSLDERFVFFSNSLKIGKQNFFTGTGPGSFEFINPSYQTSSLINSEHPHNIFLKLFAESGFITAFLFFAWTLSLFFISAKNILKTLSNGYFLITVTFFTVLLSSLIDYNFGFTIIWILFFSYAGLIANYKLREIPKEALLKTNFKYLFITILVVLAIFLANQSQVFIRLNQNPLDQKTATIPFSFKNDFINQYSFTLERYPNFLPALLASNSLTAYLKLDPYNNFEAYYLLLNQNNPEPATLRAILKDYNYLLSVNSHHTVTTKNPYFVYLIYQDLITKNPNDAVLASQFNQFKTIFFSELIKFDTRYQTNLIFNFFDELNK